MRGLDLAGRTGRARRNRDPFEIECDNGGLRLHSGDREEGSVGQPLGRAIDYEQWTQDIALRNVSWSWARNSFLPAWRSNLRGKPFGFVWDSDSYPGDVVLATTGGELHIPHRPGSLCTVQVPLSAVVT